MIRTLIAGIAAVLLDCGAAFSQVGTGAPVPSPLGIASPLGMAPGSPVPPAGIPMGATELASPGLSPAPPVPVGDDLVQSRAGHRDRPGGKRHSAGPFVRLAPMWIATKHRCCMCSTSIASESRRCLFAAAAELSSTVGVGFIGTGPSWKKTWPEVTGTAIARQRS